MGPTRDLTIELITKTPYAGSGPRGIDVYARRLYDEISHLVRLDHVYVSRDGKPHHTSDITHYTFFDPYYLTLWGRPARNRVVVTVHDLIPLKFPAQFPVGIRGRVKWVLQRAALCRVDAIVTDSRQSKQDICTFVGIDPARVHVVPLAAGHTTVTQKMVRAVRTEYKLPEKYLLYVGDINWNKNIPGLIRAFAALKDHSVHLVLVGKAFATTADIPETRAIQSALEECACQSRVHTLGFIPGHHLPALYKGATMYIQPSWYEGFGLPVLEAMEQGCPVFCARTGSLPEVGGDFVHYFDPYQEKDMAKELAHLLRDQELRCKYVTEGKKWAHAFSWQKSAKATLAVYETAIQTSL
jgi:alpha-1,3-rhamnosyl/mannosyltransferase